MKGGENIMARPDYDIPGLNKAIEQAITTGEDLQEIYTRFLATDPTEWDAGAGVDTRQQIENTLLRYGWSPETGSGAHADWGPC